MEDSDFDGAGESAAPPADSDTAWLEDKLEIQNAQTMLSKARSLWAPDQQRPDTKTRKEVLLLHLEDLSDMSSQLRLELYRSCVDWATAESHRIGVPFCAEDFPSPERLVDRINLGRMLQSDTRAPTDEDDTQTALLDGLSESAWGES